VTDVKFNIVTGLLKAMPDSGDGIKRLKTTASSTITDLAGDEMELTALQQMAATAQQNMTIFLNHKYQVPEDVLGSVEKTEIIQRENGWYDLDFDIKVDEANERAVKAWKQISNGTKLGCSIGARIPEGGYEVTKTGLKIKDVHLMEASIVGLPANPRAFVQHALKALHDDLEAEEAEAAEAAVAAPTINLNLGIPADADATEVAAAVAEAVTDTAKGGPRSENEKDQHRVRRRGRLSRGRFSRQRRAFAGSLQGRP
jgi:phage head maturation protease